MDWNWTLEKELEGESSFIFWVTKAGHFGQWENEINEVILYRIS